VDPGGILSPWLLLFESAAERGVPDAVRQRLDPAVADTARDGGSRPRRDRSRGRRLHGPPQRRRSRLRHRGLPRGRLETRRSRRGHRCGRGIRGRRHRRSIPLSREACSYPKWARIPHPRRRGPSWCPPIADRARVTAAASRVRAMIAVLLMRTKSRVNWHGSSHSVVAPLATMSRPHSSVSRRKAA
jgi:hypothetical protein